MHSNSNAAHFCSMRSSMASLNVLCVFDMMLGIKKSESENESTIGFAFIVVILEKLITFVHWNIFFTFSYILVRRTHNFAVVGDFL